MTSQRRHDMTSLFGFIFILAGVVLIAVLRH
jgi:hypothetical protein